MSLFGVIGKDNDHGLPSDFLLKTADSDRPAAPASNESNARELPPVHIALKNHAFLIRNRFSGKTYQYRKCLESRSDPHLYRHHIRCQRRLLWL